MSKLLNRIILIGVIAGFIGVIVMIVLLKTGQSAFDKNASQSAPKIVPPAVSTPQPSKKPSPQSEVPPDVSPGVDDVKAVMDKLRAKGCTNVLHPPVRVKGTVAWAPTFPEDLNLACLVLIASGGDPKKTFTVSIRTPENEKVTFDTPVPILEHIYCGQSAGRHSVNVVSTTNEVYTFAAVDCPFAVSQELLKQKQAQ